MSNVKVVKRFVLSQKGVKDGLTMEFTNKKGIKYTYNQKVVFEQLKDRFESMPCWNKHKTYTNTNNLPKFVRDLEKLS